MGYEGVLRGEIAQDLTMYSDNQLCTMLGIRHGRVAEAWRAGKVHAAGFSDRGDPRFFLADAVDALGIVTPEEQAQGILFKKQKGR